MHWIEDVLNWSTDTMPCIRPTGYVLETFCGTSEGRCDHDWSVQATLWLVMAVIQISCYSVWLMWDMCVSPHCASMSSGSWNRVLLQTSRTVGN